MKNESFIISDNLLQLLNEIANLHKDQINEKQDLNKPLFAYGTKYIKKDLELIKDKEEELLNILYKKIILKVKV